MFYKYTNISVDELLLNYFIDYSKSQSIHDTKAKNYVNLLILFEIKYLLILR